MSLPNTIIIPHGATERRLAKWLMSELRTNLIVYSPNNKQEQTVSMKGIREVLSSPPFDRAVSIHREFPDVEYIRGRGFPQLTIVPILDVDSDARSFGSYQSRDMFDGFCLGRDAVLPIYNNPNLEAVIYEAGFGHVAHDVSSFQKLLDSLDVDVFEERMRDCTSTNMDGLVRHLHRFVPRYQGRFGSGHRLYAIRPYPSGVGDRRKTSPRQVRVHAIGLHSPPQTW